MSRIVLTLLVLGLLFIPAHAVSSLPSPSSYSWLQLANEPGEYALLWGGKQVGGYDTQEQIFRPLNPNGSWGPISQLPDGVEPPPGCEPKPEPAKAPYAGDLPTGVNWQELNKTATPRYIYKGQEISRSKVLELLRKPVRTADSKQIPDDAHRPWVVAIAKNKVDRDRITKDWNSAPELVAYKNKFRFQCYDPADPLTGWPAADFKVPANVSLTVRALTADGKELSRQDYYESPAALGKALDVALRKADPNYSPEKTPDLSKPQIPGMDLLQQVPWSVWALAGAVGVFLLLGKSKLIAG